MLDRPSNKNATPNVVKAYRYYRNDEVQPGRPSYKIVEYWIPTHNIIFNSSACFKSKMPLHDADSKHHGTLGTLTAITISLSLADNFQLMLEKANPLTPERPYIFDHADCNHFNMACLDEFKSLRNRSLTITSQNGNIISDHELLSARVFKSAFKHIGNDTLKNAFKNYILHNKFPDDMVLSDLLSYYTNLETNERISIKESLGFELNNIPNPRDYWGEAPKHAAIDKPPTTLPRYANEFLQMAGIFGAITTPIVSRTTHSPALGVAGFALSGLSLFGPKAYDRYHAPTLIAARHKRADELFSHLEYQQTMQKAAP